MTRRRGSIDSCFDDPYILMAATMLRIAVEDMSNGTMCWGCDALAFIRGEEGRNIIHLLRLDDSIEFNKIMVSATHEFRRKYGKSKIEECKGCEFRPRQGRYAGRTVGSVPGAGGGSGHAGRSHAYTQEESPAQESVNPAQANA